MDPKWWYRAGIAALVVVFVLLIAKTSILGMRPDTARIDRAVTGASTDTNARKPAAER